MKLGAGPVVYIASSLKNSELNAQLDRVLMRLGYRSFLPQRDTRQPSNQFDAETARIMSEQNIKGLYEATIVLVIARNAGNDTAWEAGFAKALGKRILLLFSEDDVPQRHPMLWYSADIHLATRTYVDAEDVIITALRNI